MRPHDSYFLVDSQLEFKIAEPWETRLILKLSWIAAVHAFFKKLDKCWLTLCSERKEVTGNQQESIIYHLRIVRGLLLSLYVIPHGDGLIIYNIAGMYLDRIFS